jgi:hypothetical protein
LAKAGQSPEKVAEDAVACAGYTNAPATLTKASLLRNLDIAGKLGCLDDAGLAAKVTSSPSTTSFHALSYPNWTT